MDFMSAYFVYSEQQQVLNDAIVFDNKRFSFKNYFNEKSQGDTNLIKWFRYFSQFYDGCKEYEKNKENLNW